MSDTGFAGVYQLENGFYGYRYAIVINGKRKEGKKLRNEMGKPFRTAKQAAKAREIAIAQEQSKALLPHQGKTFSKRILYKNTPCYQRNIILPDNLVFPLL